jgi:hypothetical protein
MGRKFWLVLALVAALAVGVTASAMALKGDSATDPRPRSVTRGLDYFHARQKTDGSFGSMAATEWVIIGAVASGERIGSSMWTIGGNNPFTFLQANDHAKAATGADSDNAPVYYAHAIMSYVAAGQEDRVFVAGTPHVDLLAQLYSYQDTTEGSATAGSFSPAQSNREFRAVHTTAWAILAMKAMGVTTNERFTTAQAWLEKQQQADGGFPVQAGQPSNCEDTALAIQALSVAADDAVAAEVLPAARQFLKDNQRADGGFPATSGGRTNAWATSAAIQAILALGEKPDDSFWQTTASTPRTALAALQQKNGSYLRETGEATDALRTTAWAITALRDQPFTTYPAARPAALKAFVFKPRVLSTSPRNGAKYTTTNTVLIRATYTDGVKGTGINPKACKVFVDNQDRTKPAVIGTRELHLTLKNVPNGNHTYKLELVDHAGNTKTVQRTFVVAKTTPIIPIPTARPTYIPPPTTYPTPTPEPTTAEPYPTYSPEPYPTLTPGPTYSPSVEPTGTPGPYQSGYPISGTPVASPEATGSAEASGTAAAGQGSAAGFVGGTLLVLLPIGAAASYLVIRRREDALGSASQGEVLPGGGSAWDRLKAKAAGLKDIFKPAGRA